MHQFLKFIFGIKLVSRYRVNKQTDSQSQLNTVQLTHNTLHAATAQQAHPQPVSTEHRTAHTQHTTCCHSTKLT